ncbi:MAG: hypothetical protein ACKPA9_07020, partial [Microcystis sp.]
MVSHDYYLNFGVIRYIFAFYSVVRIQEIGDLPGNNIPIDRRAQALRPYSNGFCPQCRGELRSPKRYIIKAQV